MQTDLIRHDWLPQLKIDFYQALKTPLRVRAVDLLRDSGGAHFARLITDNGIEVLYPAHERVVQVRSFFNDVLKPFVEGADLRDLQGLIATFHRKHYKLVGLPFWSCVGTFEILALDALGHSCNKPVVELLGGIKNKKTFPIYLSSRDRTTSPEEEVAMLQSRIEATGARAVKLGIGGRMSKNLDAWPGRTEALITHARQTLGDTITIYADANGSYDAPAAIEVGHMLTGNGVAMFEEPCPYDDVEMTQQVTSALDGILVSAGESEHSLAIFRWLCRHHGVDVLQPDLLWAGGLMRAMQIAKMAETAAIPIVPHSPRAGLEQAPLLHFLAAIANPGEFHEYKALAQTQYWQCDAALAPDANGELSLPPGAGFGISIDKRSLNKLAPV